MTMLDKIKEKFNKEIIENITAYEIVTIILLTMILLTNINSIVWLPLIVMGAIWYYKPNFLNESKDN